MSQRSRLRSTTITAAILAMAASLLVVAPAAALGSDCDDAFVHRNGDLWKVYPTGTDDTANLVCAIGEAAEYSDFATIKLAEGTFHTDFLFAEGFDGRIRGAGRDATTIEPLEGGLDCVSQFEETGFVVWMAFADAHLIMKDLALSIPDVACVEPWEEFLEKDPETGEVFGFSAQDFNAMVAVFNRAGATASDGCGLTGHASLTAKRVDVDAPQPDFFAPIFNPQGAFNAFIILGNHPEGCAAPDRIVGDVLVRGVHASGVGSMIQVQSLADSHIKVVGNHTSDVDASVILVNNEGTVAKVHSNTIEGGTGVGIVSDNCQGPEPALCAMDHSMVSIHHNAISMSEIGGLGILAFDNTFVPPTIDTKIWKNHIELNGNFAGILVEDVEHDVVAKNVISGAAVFGILVEAGTTRSKIKYNDMRDLLAFEAGILLGEFTSYNKVKGNLGATVIDLGTNNWVDSGVPDKPSFATQGVAAQGSYAVGRYEAHWSAR